VPVLWHRPEIRSGDNVLPFRRPDS
jgi:hypothetical protein